MFSSLRGHGRRRWFVLGGVLLVVVGVVAAVLITRQPGNVSHPGVEFTAQPPPPPAPERPRGKHPIDLGFSWPDYHYDDARTGSMPLQMPLRPPFVQRWAVTGRVLIEFPPVICRRSLYLLKNNGALYGVSRLTGKVSWKTKLGYLAASSPSCGGGSVYAVILSRGKGIDAGRIVAVDASDGRMRWSRKLPSRSESSPLLYGGRLYFGTEDGTVYALRARDGAVRWTYKAGGAVKGGVAAADGKLYFGDYSGKVTAVRRADGKRLWQSSSAGTAFGLRAGSFYGTPAVAFGRVYLGSLDGFVYSFGSSDGKLAWRHKTGGYVYSSPAVADPPGVGPSVYVGSYDHKLYCFDARSGSVRWTHDAHGTISGGVVVIGDLVFYSNLTKRSTGALGVATGKLVWGIGRGAFNPVISDGRRLYLNGYSSLYMLSTPRQARLDRAALSGMGATADPAPSPAARRRAAKRAAARRAARRERARRRAVARRVAARRALVHRNLRLRREGRKVCFRSHGHTTCRIPKPLVCAKRSSDGRTVCRPRRR